MSGPFRRRRCGVPDEGRISHLVLATILLGLWSRPARAAPQWNVGLLASGCLLGDRGAAFERAAFCGSARGDLLFLRERTADFGLGPYLALGTTAFEDLRVSGGASALLPLAEDFPLVFSLGALLRNEGDVGVSGSVFWGLRSYNFHGSYNVAMGLSLSAERTFGDSATNSLALGVQIDGAVLVLPFLLLAGALQ